MAAVKRLAAPFGQAATQAPQPMQAAASIDASATGCTRSTSTSNGSPVTPASTKTQYSPAWNRSRGEWYSASDLLNWLGCHHRSTLDGRVLARSYLEHR